MDTSIGVGLSLFDIFFSFFFTVGSGDRSGNWSGAIPLCIGCSRGGPQLRSSGERSWHQCLPRYSGDVFFLVLFSMAWSCQFLFAHRRWRQPSPFYYSISPTQAQERHMTLLRKQAERTLNFVVFGSWWRQRRQWKSASLSYLLSLYIYIYI